MTDINLTGYAEKLITMAVDKTPSLVIAILTLIVGLWIIKTVVKGFNKTMARSKTEVSLQKFLSSLISVILKVILLISVAQMAGFNTMSFVAILGAAGLAVGLALQGSLSNFAGGVLILILKPFKVGDFIDTQGHTGTVASINVFNTILKTPDNKTVLLPNGSLSNSDLTNYSTEPTRRVDMTFGIGYDDDIKKAKHILQQFVNDDQRVLKDPEPKIVVSELADSSVNIAVKVWCMAADYWSIYFAMNEKVKLEFDQQKISIPFPQQDVHIYKHSS
jgi:small conductance mechanosensitive channel